MCRDILYVLIFGDHVQLWQNGQGLQPYRERPENPIHCELGMHNKPKHNGQQIQPIMRERISLMIIALLSAKNYQLEWPFKPYYPNGVGSNEDEEYPHDVEINRSPVIFQYHV